MDLFLVFLTIVSIAMLYYGADFLLSGALSAASKLKISEMLVSVTLIAWVTSLPEFLVLIQAINYENGPTIAYSTILGSNFANLGLVLGFSIFIKFKSKFDFNFFSIKNLIPICFLSTTSFFIYGLNIFKKPIFNNTLSLIMIFAIFWYIFIANKNANKFIEQNKDSQQKYPTLYILVGGVLLGIGSTMLARIGLELQNIGFSSAFIGSIYFALASSSPEIFTSLFAIFKYKKHDVVIGNVLGSNLANIFIFGILGIFFGIQTINLNYFSPSLLLILELIIFLIFYVYYVYNRKENIILVHSVVGLLLFSVYYLFYRLI